MLKEMDPRFEHFTPEEDAKYLRRGRSPFPKLQRPLGIIPLAQCLLICKAIF